MQIFGNNAKSTLSVAVTTNSQATITLQTGHGARFPAIQAGDYFNATLDDGVNIEIIRCVAISGDALTVTRGVEGTTAQSAFAVGTKCELRLTADGLLRFVLRQGFPIVKGIRPVGNVNSWHPYGVTFPSFQNSTTLAAATLTNSSAREQNERIRISTALGSGAQIPVQLRVAQPCVTGQDGYRFMTRFGFAFVPNSSHFFVGLLNATGVVASVFPPSSITNGIAVGWDNAGSLQGTFLTMYVANSGGPATRLSLGSYFNVNTQAWYEAEFYTAPGQARVTYTVRRLDVPSIADISSYFTSNIPDSSLWLNPQLVGASMVNSALAAEFGGWWWQS